MTLSEYVKAAEYPGERRLQALHSGSSTRFFLYWEVNRTLWTLIRAYWARAGIPVTFSDVVAAYRKRSSEVVC